MAYQKQQTPLHSKIQWMMIRKVAKNPQVRQCQTNDIPLILTVRIGWASLVNRRIRNPIRILWMRGFIRSLKKIKRPTGMKIICVYLKRINFSIDGLYLKISFRFHHTQHPVTKRDAIYSTEEIVSSMPVQVNKMWFQTFLLLLCIFIPLCDWLYLQIFQYKKFF